MDRSSSPTRADAQPTTTTTTTFTLFPKLPNEIQDMIWNYAISSLPPRIIELGYSTTTKSLTSPTLPPSLLHVSSRPRTLTLRHYTPLSFTTFTGTYISWSLDTLLFHLPSNTALFAQQLGNEDCTEMYRKCERLIVSSASEATKTTTTTSTRRSPTRLVLEFGDVARSDEEWVEHPRNPDSGRFVEDELFGWFEKLVDIGIVAGGAGEMEGRNLTEVMGADRGAARDSAFPSRRLLDQCVSTVKTIRLVKLDRGSERRMSEEEKRQRVVRDFEERKGKLDEEWEEGFEVVDVDEIWEKEIESWVEGIPEGSDELAGGLGEGFGGVLSLGDREGEGRGAELPT